MQNVFKNMNKLGLADKFNDNDAFYVWVKLIMALPLLPRERIPDMWNEMKNDALPNVPVVKLRVYSN